MVGWGGSSRGCECWEDPVNVSEGPGLWYTSIMCFRDRGGVPALRSFYDQKGAIRNEDVGRI